MHKISGLFATRREAEMAIERLVQQHRVAREAIKLGPATRENSAGVEAAGADAKRGDLLPSQDNEAALNGPIAVSLETDAVDFDALRAVFAEFGGAQVHTTEHAGGTQTPAG